MHESNKDKIKILFGIAIIIMVAGFLAGVFLNKDRQKIGDETPKNGGAIDLVRPPFLDE
ncbi:MAG: hypothetical protein WCX69_05285 [Candidatus Paceibacterota bacterium]